MNDQLLELFILVLKRDSQAVTKIKRFRKTTQSDIELIQFDFYKKGDWEESCDCWYVHEYFEYCSGGRLVQDLFNRIVENIKHLRCPHTTGQPKEYIASTKVRLIHAACAVNNKDVARYLLHENVLESLENTFCAVLSPAIVALLKDSSGTVKPNFSFTNAGRRWARRDPDTKAVTKVTMDCIPDHNSVLWCFFLNAVYSKKTLKRVAHLNYSDVHIILGHLIHTADDKTASKVLRIFSRHVESNEVPALLFQCVLWNRPKLLRIAFELFTKSKSLGFDVNKRSYCGFSLRHSECMRALEAVNQRRSSHLSLHDAFCDPETIFYEEKRRLLRRYGSPYTCLSVMYASCNYSYGCECLCQSLSKLADNNFDVNEPDEDGMTVIHAVFLEKIIENMHCLENVFETLCQLGADVNLENNQGRNALDIAMTEQPNYIANLYFTSLNRHKYFTSSNRLKVFKLVLSHNPNFNSNAIASAIERDRENTLLQFVDDETTRVVLVGDDEKEIHADTLRDKYLSLSCVAILLELGCAVKQGEVELFDELPDTLRRYLLDTLSMPHSLKAICRNVVRKTFPGPKLDRLLSVSKIPRAIVDIILFRPYLQRTKITDMNNIEQSCE